MVLFDNQALFESGTARFRIGPSRLRHALQYPPGSIGARLDVQGREARQITQSGELIADDPAGLQAAIDAIKQKMDGLACTLLDDVGRSWVGVVMTEVDAGPFIRIGARWKAAYRIEYLQVIP